MCTHQNLAGQGPGFDSKSEQLTSTTIQTDPRQRTSGPVPIRLLMRSPEVPDTLSLARPADHGGARAEAFLNLVINFRSLKIVTQLRIIECYRCGTRLSPNSSHPTGLAQRTAQKISTDAPAACDALTQIRAQHDPLD